MTAQSVESVAADRILTGPEWATSNKGPVLVRMADAAIESVSPVDEHAQPNLGRGKLLMPALSDAHDHGRGLRTLAYGVKDQPLESWLPPMRSFPPVDPYLLAAAAFARLVGSGVGAVMQSHTFVRAVPGVEEAAAVCQAARDIGVRLAFGVPLVDRNRLFYGGDELVLAHLPLKERQLIEQQWLAPIPPAEDLLDIADEIAERCEDELVSVQYAPVGPQWCSDELLEAVADRSRRTGRRVHMHFLETRRQREWADASHEMGLIPHLDSIGLLTNKLTLAHCVWLRPPEAEILAERGVTVVLNTSSNLRLRSGIAPFGTLKSSGLAFALGLDGLALDDDDDAFREMRLARLVHGRDPFEASVTAAEILSATCVAGPYVVTDSGRFGVIDRGYPADLVTLDYEMLAEDWIGPGSVGDAELVVSRATRQQVVDVIVAGRRILRNGSVMGIDHTELLSELQGQARSLRTSEEPNQALDALTTQLARLYEEGHHRSNHDTVENVD